MRDMSQRVTETTFEQEVLRAAGSVLVDFWAAWRTPCQAVAPVLERIAEERKAASCNPGLTTQPEAGAVISASRPVMADS